MNKKIGYVYGYGPGMCWVIVNEYGDYRLYLNRLLGFGHTVWKSDRGMDYDFAGIKCLGELKPRYKRLFSNNIY